MKYIDILNTPWKTEVTPEQSAEIQRILFKFGKCWADDYKSVKELDKPFIFFDKKLMFCVKNNREFFDNDTNNKLNADHIIALLKEIEEKQMIDETKDNDWIDVKDKLPKVGEKIEVKFYDDNIRDYHTKQSTLFYCRDNYYCFSGVGRKIVEDWRYIKERRPDFSKLSSGDMLIVEHFGEENKKIDKCMFILSFIDDEKTVGYSDSASIRNDDWPASIWIANKNIKKITRIDLDKQTFEEI